MAFLDNKKKIIKADVNWFKKRIPYITFDDKRKIRDILMCKITCMSHQHEMRNDLIAHFDREQFRDDLNKFLSQELGLSLEKWKA